MDENTEEKVCIFYRMGDTHMNIIARKEYQLGGKSGDGHATRFTLEIEGSLYDALLMDSGAIFTESHRAIKTPKDIKEKIKLFLKNMSQE